MYSITNLGLSFTNADHVHAADSGLNFERKTFLESPDKVSYIAYLYLYFTSYIYQHPNSVCVCFANNSTARIRPLTNARWT